MSRFLTIGLLNNMPDAALRQTERQFAALLQATAPDTTVRLELFAMAGIARGDIARRWIATRYRPVTHLAHAALDGLIVTGMEPGTGPLDSAGFWPEIAACVDLVARRGLPTLWSCLAAHAAVLHLSGIARRPLPAKLSGVFECEGVGAVTDAPWLPAVWHCVHSRQNEVTEADLAGAGYRIGARLAVGGVDSFARDDLPFLFLQGHPEYEPDTLLVEYTRDLQRFLAGQRATYPDLPKAYFTHATEAMLLDLQARLTRESQAGAVTRLLRDVVLRPRQAGIAPLVGGWLATLAASRPVMAALAGHGA